MPPASEPEPGSVSPQQPTFSPLRERRQEALLLLLAAERVDVRRAEPVVRRERQRDAGVDARQLLHHERPVERRQPRAAVLAPASRRPPARARRAARTPRAGTPASRPTRARAGRARPRQTRARSCAEAACSSLSSKSTPPSAAVGGGRPRSHGIPPRHEAARALALGRARALLALAGVAAWVGLGPAAALPRSRARAATTPARRA